MAASDAARQLAATYFSKLALEGIFPPKPSFLRWGTTSDKILSRGDQEMDIELRPNVPWPFYLLEKKGYSQAADIRTRGIGRGIDRPNRGSLTEVLPARPAKDRSGPIRLGRLRNRSF